MSQLGPNGQAEFAPGERAALESWEVPNAPADFAERVVAKGLLSRRRQRLWTAALAACLVAMVSGSVLVWGHIPSSGTLTTQRLNTVAVGTAVAVVQGQSTLSWQVDFWGRAKVQQDAGKIFYRVEPGSEFVVYTPAGKVEVTGTCFQLEVLPMDKKTVASTGASALIAAAVVATVYEGEVIAVTASETQEITAGQVATLGPQGIRRHQLEPAAGSLPRTLKNAGSYSNGEHSPTAAEEVVGQLPNHPAVAQLLLQKRQLEQKAQELQEQVAKLQKTSHSQKTYDLPKEELLAMAEKCEVRWDWIVPDSAASAGLDKKAEELDLSEAERATMLQVLQTYNQDVSAEIRKLYTELTGDPNVGSMAMESMLWEAIDKTPKRESQRVYQSIARERAGLQPAPVETASMSAFERFFRLVHGAGDRLEQAMAEELGEETARAYRDLHGGYGSKSRMRNGGCPNP